jgi:hypothetical protein
MNETNQVIQIAQHIATASGYNLSGYEIAALCSLPHVIALHFWAGVRYYAWIGGWDGIKRFLKTGTIAPTMARPAVDVAPLPKTEPAAIAAQPSKT